MIGIRTEKALRKVIALVKDSGTYDEDVISIGGIDVFIETLKTGNVVFRIFSYKDDTPRKPIATFSLSQIIGKRYKKGAAKK